MSTPLLQLNHSFGIREQPLHRVLIYAPTLIWGQQGHKQLWWQDKRLSFDKGSWLLIPAGHQLTFINQPEQGKFSSHALTLLAPPPAEWLSSAPPGNADSSFRPWRCSVESLKAPIGSGGTPTAGVSSTSKDDAHLSHCRENVCMVQSAAATSAADCASPILARIHVASSTSSLVAARPTSCAAIRSVAATSAEMSDA